MTSMYYVMRMYVRHKQNIIFIINSTVLQYMYYILAKYSKYVLPIKYMDKVMGMKF